MEYSDFYNIATYGNVAWKGSFTDKEVAQNAYEYLVEYNTSNEQGKVTHTMEELCKLLIEDIEGGSEEAEDFLYNILAEATWNVESFYCDGCGKREIVFFSRQELENLEAHRYREMLIQDAIPNKSQWIREFFVSGMCLCPKCWIKYWNGELN